MRFLSRLALASTLGPTAATVSFIAANPMILIGSLFFPFIWPVWLLFGFGAAIMPVTAIGLGLYLMSRVWAGARHWALWAATGLVAAANLTHRLPFDQNVNAFAVPGLLFATCLAGVASLIVFHAFMRPHQQEKSLFPATNIPAMLCYGAVMLLLMLNLRTTFKERHATAVPDEAQIVGNPLHRASMRPASVTLFTYVEPQNNRPSWRTTGHRVTFATFEPNPDGPNKIVTDVELRLSPREIANAGGNFGDFIAIERTFPNKIVPPYARVHVSIDRYNELRSANWPQAQSRLTPGELLDADSDCDIIWRFRSMPEQPKDRAPALINYSGTPLKSNSPQDAARFSCHGEQCQVKFPYKTNFVMFSTRRSTICHWRNLIKIVTAALDRRLVTENLAQHSTR